MSALPDDRSQPPPDDPPSGNAPRTDPAADSLEADLLPAEPDEKETAELQGIADREATTTAAVDLLYKVDARGASIVTLAVLATLFALQAASHFVIPLVVGILLAYALDPFVSFFERHRLPRWIGALLVLVALLSAVVSSGYMLRFQAQAIVDQVPSVARKVSRAINVFNASPGMGFDNIRRAVGALQKATEEATGGGAAGPAAPNNTVVVVQQAPQVKDLFVSGGINVLAVVGQAVMVIFLVYFILIAGDTFKRKFVKVAGRSLSEKKITVHMFERINLSIQRYLAMLLVTNVVLAILSWGAYRVVGLENAGTWGIVAGVLHLVPYFGPVLVTILTGVAALVQFGSFGMALLVAGISLTIATLVGVVLTTWMTGRIARMNTVAVFIGLLLFGWLWGVWGVLLAVPLVVIIKVVSDHVEGLKAFAEFLGD